MKKFLFLLLVVLTSCEEEIKYVPGFSLWAHESGHYDNTYRTLGKDIQQTITMDDDSIYFEYRKIIGSYSACGNLRYIYLKFQNDSVKKFIPNTIYSGESTISDYKVYHQYISISIEDILSKPLPIRTRFIDERQVMDTSPIYGESLIQAINNYRKWKEKNIKKELIEQYCKRINDSINNVRLNNHLHGF